MTDRDVVAHAAQLIGRALVPLPPRMSHHKPAYLTAIKGSPAVELMLAFRPHISHSRKAQIDRALLRWHGRRIRWPKAAGTCSARGCHRRATTRALCKQHYQSWWKSTRRGRASRYIPRSPASDLPAQHLVGSACEPSCELLWLAGLLEGEGSFTIQRSGPDLAYPRIGVEMCAEDVVIRVARLLGAPGIYRDAPSKPEWSPTFSTAITGRDAAEWMRRLRPLMGHRRTAAIDAALAAYKPIRLIDPPEVCVVPGCDNRHESRGLCHKHYMMWSRDRAAGRVQRITPLR